MSQGFDVYSTVLRNVIEKEYARDDVTNHHYKHIPGSLGNWVNVMCGLLCFPLPGLQEMDIDIF